MIALLTFLTPHLWCHINPYWPVHVQQHLEGDVKLRTLGTQSGIGSTSRSLTPSTALTQVFKESNKSQWASQSHFNHLVCMHRHRWPPLHYTYHGTQDNPSDATCSTQVCNSWTLNSVGDKGASHTAKTGLWCTICHAAFTPRPTLTICSRSPTAAKPKVPGLSKPCRFTIKIFSLFYFLNCIF